jgi:UDP-N-acetylmuramate: L-alanyl-gamma-D-glutamyl-meso-diaminopimelate ligase
VHLIGIGGTGMTALAGLLHASGCRVTGSDGPLYPPTSTLLARLGLEVGEGFDPARLAAPPDLVVVGNAVSRGNPEVEEVLDRALPYTSMPRLIAERFLPGRHSIVVAGTHGKTTTAAMLAWVLACAGREPSFLVGGLPRNFDLPYALGRGRAFVVEGDEYDTAFFDKSPKFVHYRPDTALVGTVEFDHADIYRDLREVETAFRRLVALVPRRGLVVRHADCPTTLAVTGSAWSRVEGYGFAGGDWRAEGLAETEAGTTFEVHRAGRPFCRVVLPLGGAHNALNALAVIAAASEQGLEAAAIVDGLARFEGVRRRLEVRGTAAGVTVIDDFAHHPTAIEATLRAVRGRYAGRRVWAVLEPRSWSLRRNVFQERLAAALEPAAQVVLAAVYRADQVPAGERLDPERLAADIAARGRPARHVPDVAEIVALLVREAAAGDVVLIMSNGGFDGLHERLLGALREREAGEPVGSTRRAAR